MAKRSRGQLVFVLSMIFFVGILLNSPQEFGAAIGKTATIQISQQENYGAAFEVLELVNAERKKEGLNALQMDEELLEAAMIRAGETTLFFSHTRPNGLQCFSVSELMYGENIAAGQRNASAVMNSWMNSSGHRANILSNRWTSIGIGCVEINGVSYWTQCFGEEISTAAKEKYYKNRTIARKISVSQQNVKKFAQISISSDSVKKGESVEVKVEWYNQFVTVSVPVRNLKYKVINKKVCKVSNGKVKGLSSGKTKVKIWFSGYKKGAVTKMITVD